MECVNYQDLYQAAMRCKQGKSGSGQAQAYHSQLIDRLFTTLAALQSYQWRPGPMRCFIANNGVKPREIHAPCYADRVVHHWLVPRLAVLIEPKFIHHSCANQVGKGTHFAVNALQKMMRQYDRPSQSYYLQLDIYNFFYTIDRATLYQLLQRHLQQAVVRGRLEPDLGKAYLWLVHRLLFSPIQVMVRTQGYTIPPHKQWLNTPPEKGLPIGNLTSQFFANVYLNELDQFVKHQLNCRHYIRYVDDMVLLSESRDQLVGYQQKIAQFLHQHLQLRLKPGEKLQRVSHGVDFLGYITRPHYRLVRRRVVHNLKNKLTAMERNIIQYKGRGKQINGKAVEPLRALLASYWGHLSHARSTHLLQKILRQFPWLEWLFEFGGEGLRCRYRAPRLISMQEQWNYYSQRYPGFVLLMQKGHCWISNHPAVESYLLKRKIDSRQAWLWGKKPHWVVPLGGLSALLRSLRDRNISHLWISEQGYSHNRLKQRNVSLLYLSNTTHYP